MPSVPQADPALRLADIHRAFRQGSREVDVLQGLDFVVAAGESVSVVGRSGSGKSTLLHVAAGLLRADRGSVEVAGKQLGGCSQNEVARWRRDHVGLVFQDYNLLPHLTVSENVALPLTLAGAKDPDRVASLLERLEIADCTSSYPETLSGGQRQRVALARAVVAGPRLVLADEPTGSLDADSAELVIDLLLETVRMEGAALVLVTHDPVVADRCDRAQRFHAGKLVAG